MPKLSKRILKERAQTLANLYIKHKGNQSRIAEALGITGAAVNQRLSNSVGETAQEILEKQVQKEAEKLGITTHWYLKKLKIGATKPKRIIGYLHQYKKTGKGIEKATPDEVISNDFIEKPDWSVQHRYLVTLGETLKYLKRGGDIKIMTQTIVGSDLMAHVKTMEETQVESNQKAD